MYFCCYWFSVLFHVLLDCASLFVSFVKMKYSAMSYLSVNECIYQFLILGKNVTQLKILSAYFSVVRDKMPSPLSNRIMRPS